MENHGSQTGPFPLSDERLIGEIKAIAKITELTELDIAHTLLMFKEELQKQYKEMRFFVDSDSSEKYTYLQFFDCAKCYIDYPESNADSDSMGIPISWSIDHKYWNPSTRLENFIQAIIFIQAGKILLSAVHVDAVGEVHEILKSKINPDMPPKSMNEVVEYVIYSTLNHLEIAVGTMILVYVLILIWEHLGTPN